MHRKHVPQNRRRVVRLGGGAIQTIQRAMAQRVSPASTQLVLLPAAPIQDLPTLHPPAPQVPHLPPPLLLLGKPRLPVPPPLIDPLDLLPLSSPPAPGRTLIIRQSPPPRRQRQIPLQNLRQRRVILGPNLPPRH